MVYSRRIKMLFDLLIELSANADEVEQLDRLRVLNFEIDEGDDDRIDRIVCGELSSLMDIMVEAYVHGGEEEDKDKLAKDVQALHRVLGLYGTLYERPNPLPGIGGGG